MATTRNDPSAKTLDSSLELLRAPGDQTEAMTGDWLKMVKSHHQMLENAFDELIASATAGGPDRPLLHKRLAYLLTAHSVAEENVLYPALAMCDLQSESDRLYLDQAHAKVMNAVLDMADDKFSESWLEKASALRTAVLEHAKVDEEGNLYPRLEAAIDATLASKLSAAYRREFLVVKPAF